MRIELIMLSLHLVSIYALTSNKLIRYHNLKWTHKLLQLRRLHDKKDWIEAEIVGEENQKKDTLFKPPKKNKEEEKESNVGLFSGIAKIFGIDKQSIQKREEKKQRNMAIDKVFEGTGLVGGLIKGFVKGFGNIIADLAVETANDLTQIQNQIADYLEDNSSALTYLGGDIRCGTPFQASSSSMNINGVVTKSFVYTMPVNGRNNRGNVQVRATANGKRIDISELIFQGSDGRVINILRSGGGDGGKGGGFIDVESI